MTPPIDYRLLGYAVQFYRDCHYTYVEVPWMVDGEFIRATLPEGSSYRLQVANVQTLENLYDGDFLVGSAEQGFLSLDLPPGMYVGCTPCFRDEPKTDLLYQDTFMKVELFNTLPNASVIQTVQDAKRFFRRFIGVSPDEIETAEGTDLMLAGIEIGSYGERTHGDLRWVYGTGLALPRFSTALALSKAILPEHHYGG